MSKIKNAFHDEIEIRALFDADSDLSENEAFEILSEAGIDDISHISKSLNNSYANWQYLTLK